MTIKLKWMSHSPLPFSWKKWVKGKMADGEVESKKGKKRAAEGEEADDGGEEADDAGEEVDDAGEEADDVGEPSETKTKITKGRTKGPVDYDKQCGVINDKGLPCSRSLECKAHSMGAKRSVNGRSKAYDELLLEWNRANNPKWVEPVDLLDFDATRLARARDLRRNPALSPFISCAPSQTPPKDPQQRAFIRHLREFLRFSSFTDANPPVLNEQPRDPLDVLAPSLLLPIHSPSSQATPQGELRTDRQKNSRRTSATWGFVHGTHAAPPIVDVPLAPGLSRVAVAFTPKKDEDLVPAEYFDVPSSNPESQKPTAATPINSAEHGSHRLCFCL